MPDNMMPGIIQAVDGAVPHTWVGLLQGSSVCEATDDLHVPDHIAALWDKRNRPKEALGAFAKLPGGQGLGSDVKPSLTQICTSDPSGDNSTVTSASTPPTADGISVRWVLLTAVGRMYCGQETLGCLSNFTSPTSSHGSRVVCHLV